MDPALKYRREHRMFKMWNLKEETHAHSFPGIETTETGLEL
jgi:hypothetical protein